MTKYLTQAWLDLQRELAQTFPAKPGATARIQYVVTGAPDGDVKYYSAIENGAMLENTLGEDPEAEFTLTQSYDDAVMILNGELDVNAAFMQGRVRATGNMGKLMSLLPLTQSSEYKAIQADLAEQTDF